MAGIALFTVGGRGKLTAVGIAVAIGTAFVGRPQQDGLLRVPRVTVQAFHVSVATP
jgi:hypothetical protein